MVRAIVIMLGCLLACASAGAESRSVTWTGWFSDSNCSAPRVASGQLGPNGTACVKRCLDRGLPAVFISEQAKAALKVIDYANVKEDVGYHVEVTGTFDESASTISVQSVKRLAEVAAMCALPKKR
jgi:hypothetical protein